MAESYEFLRPIVQGWLGKLAEARTARKTFDDEAEQCVEFFSGACGFMWNEKFQNKYIKGRVSPKFKITIQKAFELVALYAPSLCWQHPARTNKPRKMLDIPLDVFGPPAPPQQQQIPGMPPQQSRGDMLREFYQKEQTERQNGAKVRAMLLDGWLNYTPTEQPGGGLSKHMQLACTEALVKGRGTLWPEVYKMPASDRVLTGCFYDTVDNLLIDPDATNLYDAKWVARRCCHPIWQVAREYGIPEEELRSKGQKESAGSRGERMGSERNNMKRAQGKTFDTMVYYKIWSKGGVGARLTGVDFALKKAFDNVVGDYAYVVVAEGMSYPLNVHPTALLDKELEDDDIRRLMEWPVPYWKDDKWPVACLDFWPHVGTPSKPASPWPRAPMAPGLGELMYVNMFMSHLAGRVWSSSRDFIAVLESALSVVKPALEGGGDLSIIPIPEVHKNIAEAITFLQQPQVNKDAFIMIDRMMDSFEKRVFLNDMLYGMNPGDTQLRTASDVETKKASVSVVPDYMAQQVEAWMTETGDMEKLCTRWYVEPKDVADLFGKSGAMLWEEYITNEDPELVVREMRCTIEAGSARKPNKQRDSQNMQSALPVLVPELSKHADVTGDTGPINAFIKQWGDAQDFDITGFQMGPRVPQAPPPEQQQMQQQMQQLEAGKLQAEIAKTNADAQKTMAEAGSSGNDLQLKMQESQMKLRLDAASAQQKMQVEREKNQADLHMKQMDLAFDQQRGQQEMGMDQARFQQEMQQNEQSHLYELLNQRQQIQMQREQGEQGLELGKQEAEQKIKTQKAMASAKPKPNGAVRK